MGVSPNISFLKNTAIETDRGVLVNEYFETNITDIFAIGDCVQHKNPPLGRKPVEQVWYTGRIHGEILAATISGKKTVYTPGYWFNSAKFLDIEYQTYGVVNPILEEHETSFYWEHPAGRICLRIVYNKNDATVIGFNAFGIRLRHAVCNQWLREKKQIDDVIVNLQQANFDPEFFHKYENEILSAYNKKSGKHLSSKKKKSFSLFSW